MDSERPQPVIVCAAILVTEPTGETLIVTGVRHYCPLMVAALKRMNVSRKASVMAEQGFVDQFGNFLDRREALAVATAAGQINTRRPKAFPMDELFSEDLY